MRNDGRKRHISSLYGCRQFDHVGSDRTFLALFQPWVPGRNRVARPEGFRDRNTSVPVQRNGREIGQLDYPNICRSRDPRYSGRLQNIYRSGSGKDFPPPDDRSVGLRHRIAGNCAIVWLPHRRGTHQLDQCRGQQGYTRDVYRSFGRSLANPAESQGRGLSLISRERRRSAA